MFCCQNFVPSTYPNSIVICNPQLHTNRIHNPVSKYSLYGRSNSSYSHPPGFSEPLCGDVSRNSSFSHPPGFPKPPLVERKFDKQRTIKEDRNQIDGRNFNQVGEGEVKHTIFLFNVSNECSKENIRKCCSIFGTVDKISVHSRSPYAATVFVFVRFVKSQDAAIAWRRLKGTRRFGRSWGTDWARKELSVADDAESSLQENFQGIVGIENPKAVGFLGKSWMLVSGNTINLREACEFINECGLNFKKFFRWGLYAIIVVCEDEQQVMEWVANQHKLGEKFLKVEKIDINKTQLSNYCWIECSGIPVQAWSFGTMNNIAEKWGSLLALDKETDQMWRVDVARLFIEIDGLKELQLYSDFSFRKGILQIKVEEISDVYGIDAILSPSCQLGYGNEVSGALLSNNGDDLDLKGAETSRVDTEESVPVSTSLFGGQNVEPHMLEANVSVTNEVDELGESGTPVFVPKCNVESTDLDFQDKSISTPVLFSGSIGRGKILNFDSPHSHQSSKRKLPSWCGGPVGTKGRYVANEEFEKGRPETNPESSDSFSNKEYIVPETNPSQVCFVQNTQILTSAVLKGGEAQGGIRSCKAKNCVGCDNYKKKKEKEKQQREAGTVQGEERPKVPSIEMAKEAIPSTSAPRKSKSTAKKGQRTPLRLGPRGVLEGRIVKRASGKKGIQHSKAKVREKEISASQKRSNRKPGFGIDRGLRILDEIGVNLSDSSAHRLKFNELFHGYKAADPIDNQEEGISNTSIDN